MSLHRNIAASYVSQIYVSAIGIIILPLYIRFMGDEAYGLVGFFTMLQAWFALLDMGLTPTIGRETSRYRGGSTSGLIYRQLFRALNVVFFLIALFGGCILWLLADQIAQTWLHFESLNTDEVVVSVKIMAISVALRWFSGLYRGVITGFERLVWLSGFNVAIATLRFVAVFFTMWFFGFEPLIFFLHQLVVACVEVLGLWWAGSRLLPRTRHISGIIGWTFRPVIPLLKFALTIAFTSAIWVLVTQTDKLVLSGVLSLAEYGYFSLAVLAASGIMVISGPISTSIMPLMAKLNAQGKHEELLKVYRNATQMTTAICGSAAITVAFTAKSLLFAWTGDMELATRAAPILRLYAIGNGFLALAAFPYYLQYALGNLRYHMIGNALLVIFLIPAIIVAAKLYGGVGAGWVWLALNSAFLLLWVGVVHYKLVSGLHWVWLKNDILFIVLPVTFVVAIFSEVHTLSNSRLNELAAVLFVSLISLAIAAFMSPHIRYIICSRVRNGA